MGSLYPDSLGESLFGIEFKDIDGLVLLLSEFYRSYFIFSVLQLGTTDILHLLAARHLGAKHFLTFDSDFARVRALIAEYLDIKVCVGTEEINAYISSLSINSR
jgi:hypothetical protein